MTDKELIRRALMGSQEAQRACTDKGIALPCPFCGGEAIIEYDSVAPFEYDVVCGDCGVTLGISEDKNVALREWNTRPAPPVGRCGECKSYTALGHCKLHSQEPDQHDTGAYVEMLPDDFCSYFEPKED